MSSQLTGWAFLWGSFDTAHLAEAYEVREYLEGLAARRACAHASHSDLAALEEMAERIWALSNAGKVEEMGAVDRAFHLQIMSLSRNRILLRLAEGYRVLGMAVRTAREPRQVHEEHTGIVDAIKRNLPDEAEKLARQHVEETRRTIALEAEREDYVPMWVLNSQE